MSLATPEEIRTLQRKLYRKAKAEPAFRFYLLYDKICREDILAHAYALARANAGAPGTDGMTFAQVEAEGLEEWLAGLREDLTARTYRPAPVRRVMIPKPGGGERAFGGGWVLWRPGGVGCGALLLGATDRAIGLIDRFVACFADDRRQELVVHPPAALVGQCVFAIALGYEDVNDHDQLRHDPVLGALSGCLEARYPRCAPLAGKSTLNRLEHAPEGGLGRYHKIGHEGAAIERLFVALFLEAHKTAPKRLVLDLDATVDPVRGHQEGRSFHRFYDCYCYVQLYVFCGRHLLAAKLRRANIGASAGVGRSGRAGRVCGSCCGRTPASPARR